MMLINMNLIPKMKDALYGNVDIARDRKKYKYIWNFRCWNIKPFRGPMCIGIAVRTKESPNRCVTSYYNPYHYSLITRWRPLSGDSHFMCFGRGPMNSGMCNKDHDHDPKDEFKTGDEIRMELNTKKKSLIYYKNGDKVGTSIKNIQLSKDIAYNMAVSMNRGKYCVELISFEVQEAK